MKKDKKQHGKKSYSFRRKKARMRTSSGASSEATCCIILSPTEQSNCSSTVSFISTPSSSRSSSIRNKATRIDFLSPLDSSYKEKLKSIAFYIDNREVMVRYMFALLHKKELYELLPENLKKLGIAELRYLCIKELNEMSTKNICTILKGKDFAESIGSEGEKDKALIVGANIKTSKAEIAVADSTTEMTGPNLINFPRIFHAVDADNTVVCNNIISIPEVCYATAEKNSLIMMHQKSETVIQNFGMERKIPLLSNQHAKIFAIEKASSLKGQTSANTTTENGDELEDGEVVSDQEKNSSSSKTATLNKDQNCDQCFATYKDIFIDKAHNDLSPSSIPKNLEKNSDDTTKKVREEKKLNMLELELRARAIKALIRRNDNKP